MAEAPSAAAVPAADEPGARGRLTVSDRAVRRIAEAAARSVRGVARSGESTGALGSALGRGYPRIDLDVAGERARVEARIATHWPLPAAEVADAVRARVGDQLHRLAGVRVDAITVTVDEVVRRDPAAVRRVR